MCSNLVKRFSNWIFHLPQLIYTVDLIRVRPTASKFKICIRLVSSDRVLQQHKWMKLENTTLNPQYSAFTLISSLFRKFGFAVTEIGYSSPAQRDNMRQGKKNATINVKMKILMVCMPTSTVWELKQKEEEKKISFHYRNFDEHFKPCIVGLHTLYPKILVCSHHGPTSWMFSSVPKLSTRINLCNRQQWW